MIIAPDKEVIGLDNREMHLINITIFIANAYAFIQIKRSVKGDQINRKVYLLNGFWATFRHCKVAF